MGTPSGTSGGAQTSHAENLLDIDFDGAAPASLQNAPGNDISGLEGLAGTPMRVASPVGGQGAMGGMEDLMGVFGQGSGVGASSGGGGVNGGANDLLDGFASMGVQSRSSQQPPPPGVQLDGGKNGQRDMLDLI